MPKDKRTKDELAAQLLELADLFELGDARVSDVPAWQDRLRDITNFLPDNLTADLVDQMQMLADDGNRNIAAFSRIHGLTKAEEKLLASLATGLTVPDHAKKAGISVNTGRVHMQRILDKTAASGQLDLIKMLNNR